MDKTKEKLPNIMTSFTNGARKGLQLVLNTAMPGVVFAFAITRLLTISGLMGLIGKLLSPIMMIFGLPGEAAMPLVLSYTSLFGGISSAAALAQSGILNATHVAIMIPFIYLTGGIFVYTARILNITGIKAKDFKIPYVIATINAVLSLLVMRVVLMFI